MHLLKTIITSGLTVYNNMQQMKGKPTVIFNTEVMQFHSSFQLLSL